MEEADRRLWNHTTKSIALIDGSKAALQSTLENCKPKSNRPSYGPDLLEYVIEWFANWMLIVVPEPELRENVLQELKCHTHEHAGRFSV